MPRRPRLHLTDVPQHIIQRSNNRQATFLRFKASLVDTETYFLRCCRYIECNPVRAQMVAAPGGYPWSSYRYHAFGAPDNLLSMHEPYEKLGATPQRRQEAYRGLFRYELDSGKLAEIRETVNRGWPLGGERFKDEIEGALKCAARPPRRGRPRRAARLVSQG